LERPGLEAVGIDISATMPVTLIEQIKLIVDQLPEAIDELAEGTLDLINFWYNVRSVCHDSAPVALSRCFKPVWIQSARMVVFLRMLPSFK